MAHQRPVMPPVYNSSRSEGRTSEQTKLFSTHELNTALHTKVAVKVEKVSEQFTTEIAEIRTKLYRHTTSRQTSRRIVGDELRNIQEIIDDSDVDSDLEIEAFMPKPKVKEEPIEYEIDNALEPFEQAASTSNGFSNDNADARGSSDVSQRSKNGLNLMVSTNADARGPSDVGQRSTNGLNLMIPTNDSVSGSFHYYVDVSLRFELLNKN